MTRTGLDRQRNGRRWTRGYRWLCGLLPRPGFAPILLVAALCLAIPSPTIATDGPHYPDLRTLPPSDLKFDTAVIDGVSRPVLRFANTVWNAGRGPLHLVAKNDKARRKSQVFQRTYSDYAATGAYTERRVGEFVFHPGHNHFHFENFAQYHLWEAAAWDQWVASNRSTEEKALRRGAKTTFCIMDTQQRDATLVGSPTAAGYTLCGRTTQGMSVGWGDTYGAHLADQWIVLDTPVLANGSYVLRSVADPLNVLQESANKDAPANADREGAQANEAITRFSVQNGVISLSS